MGRDRHWRKTKNPARIGLGCFEIISDPFPFFLFFPPRAREKTGDRQPLYGMGHHRPSIRRVHPPPHSDYKKGHSPPPWDANTQRERGTEGARGGWGRRVGEGSHKLFLSPILVQCIARFENIGHRHRNACIYIYIDPGRTTLIVHLRPPPRDDPLPPLQPSSPQTERPFPPG
jgi:hypothetical protein